jgi:putative membrane protein
MHWILRVILTLAGNALALWVAYLIVPGFILNANVHAWTGILQLVVIALILALLNWIVKPILTLVLGPIIILTLGLGLIVVNALILFVLPILANYLDFSRGSITIQTIPALIFATLIVSIINFAIHLIA